MRVIAGTARSLKLVTPAGMNTRPTSDKIKETLFNIIQMNIPGCSFLDLFSGSGGIAIEALSRGAKEAVMVDSDRDAVKCINENIKHTGFEKNATCLSQDVFRAINSLGVCGRHFDIVFMDPPYKKELEENVLKKLKESQIVDSDTLIIIEAALDTDFSFADKNGWDIVRVKRYKTNQHVFLKKAE